MMPKVQEWFLKRIELFQFSNIYETLRDVENVFKNPIGTYFLPNYEGSTNFLRYFTSLNCFPSSWVDITCVFLIIHPIKKFYIASNNSFHFCNLITTDNIISCSTISMSVDLTSTSSSPISFTANICWCYASFIHHLALVWSLRFVLTLFQILFIQLLIKCTSVNVLRCALKEWPFFVRHLGSQNATCRHSNHFMLISEGQ